MKDPAALFYFNDWMGGTATLSRHLKGCYMDLLCVQFNSGALSLEEIKTVLGSDFGSVWPALQKKFKCENGLYFNERLMLEKDKRKKFSESRRANAKHMPKHMENENRNENTITNKIPKEETAKFFEVVAFDGDEYLKLVEEISKKLNISQELANKEIKKFINYWSEKTASGKKRRWETEKTFEVQLRLAKWFNNAAQWEKEKKTLPIKTRTIANL